MFVAPSAATCAAAAAASRHSAFLASLIAQEESLASPRPAAQLTAAALAAADIQQPGQAADAGWSAGDTAVAATSTEKPLDSTRAAASDDGGSSGSSSSSDASSSGGGGGGQGVRTGVWFDVEQGEGQPPAKMELLEEPVAEDCHMEAHADYDGPALTWGLTYKKASAAQCCQACKEFQPQPDGQRCNVWVYCGSRTGECWSPDIWNHTTGECWLKYQAEWDNVVDRQSTNLAVNRRGRYPDAFRSEHKTAPEEVQWTAGVIPAGG